MLAGLVLNPWRFAGKSWGSGSASVSPRPHPGDEGTGDNSSRKEYSDRFEWILAHHPFRIVNRVFGGVAALLDRAHGGADTIVDRIGHHRLDLRKLANYIIDGCRFFQKLDCHKLVPSLLVICRIARSLVAITTLVYVMRLEALLLHPASLPEEGICPEMRRRKLRQTGVGGELSAFRRSFE